MARVGPPSYIYKKIENWAFTEVVFFGKLKNDRQDEPGRTHLSYELTTNI